MCHSRSEKRIRTFQKCTRVRRPPIRLLSSREVFLSSAVFARTRQRYSSATRTRTQSACCDSTDAEPISSKTGFRSRRRVHPCPTSRLFPITSIHSARVPSFFPMAAVSRPHPWALGFSPLRTCTRCESRPLPCRTRTKISSARRSVHNPEGVRCRTPWVLRSVRSAFVWSRTQTSSAEADSETASE
jgi:hypothetical protein